MRFHMNFWFKVSSEALVHLKFLLLIFLLLNVLNCFGKMKIDKLQVT